MAVRLRLHPDGHWMPDTPGQWDYTRSDRKTPSRVTVYEYKGGLNVRFTGGNEESVRILAPGTWEWVTPTGDEGGKE